MCGVMFFHQLGQDGGEQIWPSRQFAPADQLDSLLPLFETCSPESDDDDGGESDRIMASLCATVTFAERLARGRGKIQA